MVAEEQHSRGQGVDFVRPVGGEGEIGPCGTMFIGVSSAELVFLHDAAQAGAARADNVPLADFELLRDDADLRLHDGALAQAKLMSVTSTGSARAAPFRGPALSRYDRAGSFSAGV